MKKYLVAAALFNVILITALVSFYVLAVANLFHPGDFLYGAQRAAEDELIQLTGDPLRRATIHLDLVERRLANISMAESDYQLDLALIAFDHCLSEALNSIQSLTAVQARELSGKADHMLAQANTVLANLDHQANSALVAHVKENVQALQFVSTTMNLQRTDRQERYIPGEIIARIVPFLGIDVDHGDFPMSGGHEAVECLDCHNEGTYENTPTDCVACHTLDRELALLTSLIYDQYLPLEEHNAKHYSDDCAACHSVDDWTTILYDHKQVQQCNPCHIADIPEAENVRSMPKVIWNIAWKTSSANRDSSVKHYPGDCSACHLDIESWETITFDHRDTCKSCHSELFLKTRDRAVAGTVPCSQNCESCHNVENHEEDYPGRCTNCHNDVEDWQVVSVDHTAYTLCYQCHTDDRPADHYSGSCKLCHSTTNWKEAAVDHNYNSNCRTCHQRPNTHSSQQCSTCHTTKNWWDKVKNHSTGICSDCHDSPASHFGADCTGCHSPSDWRNPTLAHKQPLDCITCHTAPQDHYPNKCSDCHSTVNWSVSSALIHSVFTSCLNCHSAPASHWLENCSDCHSTMQWGVDVVLIHNTSQDCVSCHTTPKYHWPGECTNCHSTLSWTEVTFDHTGYTDCKACHPRPSGHERGQCSKCHSTLSWTIEEPTETATTDPTLTLTSTPESSETPTPTDECLPSATPTPSDTPEPSETPTPFDIPVPSATPTPSDTSTPPVTPAPTDTPTP